MPVANFWAAFLARRWLCVASATFALLFLLPVVGRAAQVVDPLSDALMMQSAIRHLVLGETGFHLVPTSGGKGKTRAEVVRVKNAATGKFQFLTLRRGGHGRISLTVDGQQLVVLRSRGSNPLLLINGTPAFWNPARGGSILVGIPGQARPLATVFTDPNSHLFNPRLAYPGPFVPISGNRFVFPSA